MFRLNFFFFHLSFSASMEIENFKKWKKSSLWIPKDEKRGQRSIFASEKRYRKVLFRTPSPGSIFFCTLLSEGTMNMTWKIVYENYYHTEVWLLWCLLYRQVIWNYIRRKMWTNIILFGSINLWQTWNTSTVKSRRKAPLQPCPL